MHRLFVALRPPAPIRRQLLSLMGGVPGARWQDDEQLHLTLRFIGEVDRHQGEDIAVALGAVHHPPLDLALDRIGQFDRRGRVDTLWIGITPRDALEALHRKIGQALARVGIAPEQRAYLPHITLARFTRPAGGIDVFAGRAGAMAGTRFEAGDFGLYESALGRDGARYTLVARYPFAAGG